MVKNIQEYEQKQDEKKLIEILQEAEEFLEEKDKWLSLEELKVSVGV